MFREKLEILNSNPFSLFRINHYSWWERELPSDQEMEEGINNLKIVNNKVDYIITHSPYSSILPFIINRGCQTDRLTDYLQGIKDSVSYKQWYFGHMHVNMHFDFDKSTCLFKKIEKIL